MSKRNAVMKKGPAAAGPAKTYDIVLRVSRRNGREGDRFLSPKEQQRVTCEWIEANGHSVGHVHDETDSVSGGTTDRVGLQAALARALAGECDGIVVAKVDRFARSLESGLRAVKELEEAGREFIAVQDGLVGRAEGPTARLMRGMLFLMAEWQRDSLSVGWEAVRANHIARGVHPSIPFGYQRSDGPGTPLKPEPSEAGAVRHVFEQRAHGATWVALATWLNDEGFPTRRGSRWTHNRIKDMIESRAYLGEAYSGEYVNQHAHEPLVTRTMWERANDTRKSSGDERVTNEYALRGIVRCASCGTRMVGFVTRKGTDQRRYRCKRRFAWGDCPEAVSVDAHEVEDFAIREFFRRYVDVSVVGGHDDDGALALAEAELEDALADLRHYRDMGDEAREALNLAGEDMYEEGLVHRARRVTAAREGVATAKATTTGLLVPDDLADNWDTMTVAEQRDLLAAGFDALMVRPVGLPIEERVRVFGHGEAPADLPGKGGGRDMRPVL